MASFLCVDLLVGDFVRFCFDFVVVVVVNPYVVGRVSGGFVEAGRTPAFALRPTIGRYRNTLARKRQRPRAKNACTRYQTLLMLIVAIGMVSCWPQNTPMSPDGVMPLPDFRDLAKKPRKKDRQKQATQVHR